MRLSELLHSRVVDAAGTDLGAVDDVRLVQDGPLLGTFGAALRIDGLVVGHGALGLRIGYHRAGVRGPWPLAVLLRALERRARFVPWDDVAAWDGEVVRLRVEAGALASIADV